MQRCYSVSPDASDSVLANSKSKNGPY